LHGCDGPNQIAPKHLLVPCDRLKHD
jgi:hypothetical protein